MNPDTDILEGYPKPVEGFTTCLQIFQSMEYMPLQTINLPNVIVTDQKSVKGWGVVASSPSIRMNNSRTDLNNSMKPRQTFSNKI